MADPSERMTSNHSSVLDSDDNACMNQHLIDAMTELNKPKINKKMVNRHLRYIGEHLDGVV